MGAALLLGDIIERLERLGVSVSFQDGCSNEALRSLEAKLDLKLPAPLRDMLSHRDGEVSEFAAFGMLGYDCRLLSCAGIDSAVQRIKDASAFFGDVDLANEGAVKSTYYNCRWVPFISSPYLGYFLDLDPAPGGRVGQVIVANVEEGYVRVVSDDVEDFLEEIINGIDSGKYKLDENGYWAVPA